MPGNETGEVTLHVLVWHLPYMTVHVFQAPMRTSAHTER